MSMSFTITNYESVKNKVPKYAIKKEKHQSLDIKIDKWAQHIN